MGASSAIGAAIRARLQARGDEVVGVSLEPDRPGDLVADCADPAAAREAFATVLDRFDGRVDVLVPAAALNPRARIEDQTDDMWRTALGATLDSAFYTLRALLPHMPSGGAVVVVSSVMARHVSPGVAGYAAAKGGLEALVRVAALEQGARGVRVNAVAPGLVGGVDLEAATEGYPLRRSGSPDEVAAVVDFLASPDASFVTGVVVPVDGGLSVAQTGAWFRPDLRRLIDGTPGGDR